MQFQLITKQSEMDALARSWNALLEESASHVPFLRCEYLRDWWETLGGGEWQQGELAVVAGWEGERLVGLAPLFASHSREGIPSLLLLGSIEVSDFLDLIARPADLPAFIEGLLDFLASPQAPHWQSLDLWNILDSSPTLPLLEAAARRRGWSYQQEMLQHSPFIPLPGDWETYLAGIDKKQRHEIRRKMRRAEESDIPVSWYVVQDPSTVDAEAEAFMAMMALDPDKAAFLTPPMRVHFTKTVRCAFESGCLQMAFLTVDGEKAAAYFSMNYLERIWVYNSAIDQRFSEYSPGWVLLGHLLRWANENGIKEFDFMRGNEAYKYRFGGIDRFVMRAVIKR